jgi:hypothetical protein
VLTTQQCGSEGSEAISLTGSERNNRDLCDFDTQTGFTLNFLARHQRLLGDLRLHEAADSVRLQPG